MKKLDWQHVVLGGLIIAGACFLAMHSPDVLGKIVGALLAPAGIAALLKQYRSGDPDNEPK